MSLEVPDPTPGFEIKIKLEREAAWMMSNNTQHLYTVMSHQLREPIIEYLR